MAENGWTFAPGEGVVPDSVNGVSCVHQLYAKADPSYSGRATVPMLWDKKQRTIVNNESSEIIRMLNTEFNAFTNDHTDYYPQALRPQIDEINKLTYEKINNGVYRSGFAKTQAAYEEACRALFDALDKCEAILSRQRYLVGDRITEADWRLFPTLVRFDPVYNGHFKCNIRRLADYPNLSNYTRELYQVPGIAETIDIQGIKAGYYGGMPQVNPTGIVPLGPEVNFAAPHDRDRFKKAA
jgi:putative glutathione S-transferase